MYADLILRSNSIVTCVENTESDSLDGYIGIADGRIIAVGYGNPRKNILVQARSS